MIQSGIIIRCILPSGEVRYPKKRKGFTENIEKARVWTYAQYEVVRETRREYAQVYPKLKTQLVNYTKYIL